MEQAQARSQVPSLTAAYVFGIGLGLFPGREVTACPVFHIVANVQERLGVASRLRFDVVREDGQHGRRVEPVGKVDRLDVGGEGGADRAGDPVGADPGEELVRGEGRSV